jgi:hypothetical protein
MLAGHVLQPCCAASLLNLSLLVHDTWCTKLRPLIACSYCVAVLCMLAWHAHTSACYSQQPLLCCPTHAAACQYHAVLCISCLHCCCWGTSLPSALLLLLLRLNMLLSLIIATNRCCCCCCSVPAKPQPSAVQLEEEALARIQAAVAERYAAAIAGPDVQVRSHCSMYGLSMGFQKADAGAYPEQSVLVLRQYSYMWVQSPS